MRAALLLAWAAAHAPAIWWYLGRTRHASTDRVELVALLAAGLFVLTRIRRTGLRSASLVPAAGATIVYAASVQWASPLVQATLAATSLSMVVAATLLGRRYHPGLHGLCLLALPWIPLFQYQLGDPLRAITAEGAAFLLRLGQFEVHAAGNCLAWGEQLLWVDAPCSGIRMLWSGLLLSTALGATRDFGIGKTALLSASVVLVVLGCNALRAASLFYLEVGVFEAPGWAHEGAGTLVFALAAVGFVAVFREKGAPRCRADSYT